MAAIDSMLRMMSVRGAEVMIIAAGEPPTLRRRGQPQPMSMPPLDPALVSTFVEEIVDEDRRARLDEAGTLDMLYLAGDGARFAVLLESLGSGIRMSFRPAGRSTAPVSPAALPAPPPEPTQPRGGSSADAHVASPSRDVRVGAGTGSGDELGSIGRALAHVGARGASDLIVSEGRAARIKVDGAWIQVGDSACESTDILALVDLATDHVDREELQRNGSVDFALEWRGDRFRANVFRQNGGVAAALRPIRTDVPTLEQLNLPSGIAKLVDYPHGLVLVTGPAGSGKSTTMVALIEEINRTRTKHIITLEDPIEYMYTPNQSLIHQREVGRDLPSFAAGLRAALREAPDIIMLGEMRDLETISAALTAAETGHLVLGTLHCGDAASAIDRIIDVFPAHQQRQVRSQLGVALRAVVTQVLLPSRHGGRVPAHELMVVNSAVANLIRDDKVYQVPTAIATSKNEGMVPLERTLARLVRSGRVDRTHARNACADAKKFDDLMSA